MLFRINQYLTFLFNATNQHGVHSPFVYDLVTKCFYKRESNKVYAPIKPICKKTGIAYKTGKLLNHIPSYFDCKKALVIEGNKSFISQIISFENPISIDNTVQKGHQYDIIYVSISELQYHLNTGSLFSMIHNNSVIITNSIHESETSTLIWKKIKMHPKVRVTIDIFSLGFIFFRKEQAKEHFTIRV